MNGRTEAVVHATISSWPDTTKRDAHMTFNDLFRQWQWRPIHNCPGRFVLTEASPSLSMAALVGQVQVREFHVAAAKDAVLVVPFVDGGLISYKRTDGSYLHTLNTSEGFARKLSQLGISLD